MRQTLGAIIAVSLLGAGCASLQETKTYNGPFGRTEVGAVMIAADPASSKVLVETYDGDLWIYDVDGDARGRLTGLRVGDEVILSFDDRIAGKRAIAISVIAPGRRPLPPGMLTVADLLPTGAVFGAPAIPTYVAGGRAVHGRGRPRRHGDRREWFDRVRERRDRPGLRRNLGHPGRRRLAAGRDRPRPGARRVRGHGSDVDRQHLAGGRDHPGQLQPGQHRSRCHDGQSRRGGQADHPGSIHTRRDRARLTGRCGPDHAGPDHAGPGELHPGHGRTRRTDDESRNSGTARDHTGTFHSRHCGPRGQHTAGKCAAACDRDGHAGNGPAGAGTSGGHDWRSGPAGTRGRRHVPSTSRRSVDHASLKRRRPGPVSAPRGWSGLRRGAAGPVARWLPPPHPPPCETPRRGSREG